MTILNGTITSWIGTQTSSSVGSGVYSAVSNLARGGEGTLGPDALQDRAFLFVDAYGAVIKSRPNAPWSVRDDQTRYNDAIFAGTSKMQQDPSSAEEGRAEIIAVITELEELIADNLPI